MPDLISSFISKVWKLTLPTGEKGKPKEIFFPELDTYEDDNFKQIDDGIEMQCPTNGVTTPGSSYPRCELREMTVDGQKASWDYSSDDEHLMEWEVVVHKLPDKKPHVCIGQIHDVKDDILEIRVEGEKLVARGRDIKGYIPLMDFELSKAYKFAITVSGGITSFHNLQDNIKITFKEIPLNVKGCYFKCGNYVQSNPSKGDAKAVSVIFLKNVKLTHKKITKPPPEDDKPPPKKKAKLTFICGTCEDEYYASLKYGKEEL